AIAKDPNYAVAYAGLADSYTLLSVFSAASPQDSIPQARVAAKKALELDNTLAEAHASSGRILSGYDYDFERAIAEFERARSEEHTSELQSLRHLVCRLLLE